MATTQDTDRDLATTTIAAARRGDAEALGLVYARYHGRVRRYVEGILGDGHDAEDVTQQVFMRLPAALARYEERPASFAAWLLRVARNAALDRMRTRATLPLEELGATPAWADDVRLERRSCLREALEALPHDQRQVVLMRHVVGLTTPEIAAALGRSEGSVHALHHRGRAGLRRRLGELGLTPATVT
jgi:RNA polymerase sigma-70 factor, ECF subfamily